MEREVNRRADEIVNEYVDKKYREAVEEVTNIGEYCDVGRLVEMVNDVNSWTKFIAGENADLYEDFKLHVYWLDGQVFVMKGKELND